MSEWESVDELAVCYEPIAGERRRVGRMARRGREIYFAYDAAFLASGLELSPLKLPLRPGVTPGERALDGLAGVFDDSLPDGWGRLLLDRRAAQLGLNARTLTPLDRLTVVGPRAMGALVYEPERPLDEPQVVKLAALAAEADHVLRGAGGVDLEQLIALGGSPQGARPKVLVQIAPDGTIHAGARDIVPGCRPLLVKFPAPSDEPHAAALEHAYALMARAAGIAMPPTEILGKTTRSRGYFAIERFDRVVTPAGVRRVHMHTLGGLLELPHGYPALDYVEVLATTRRLTRHEGAVGEQYRRACFNVLAHNRDDHCRNFAFVMSEQGRWTISPAYDLTYHPGPNGEHTAIVAGEARAPTLEHLRLLAARAEVVRPAPIVDEVRAAVQRFARFADEAGVPARVVARVAGELGVPVRPRAARQGPARQGTRRGAAPRARKVRS